MKKALEAGIRFCECIKKSTRGDIWDNYNAIENVLSVMLKKLEEPETVPTDDGVDWEELRRFITQYMFSNLKTQEESDCVGLWSYIQYNQSQWLKPNPTPSIDPKTIPSIDPKTIPSIDPKIKAVYEKWKNPGYLSRAGEMSRSDDAWDAIKTYMGRNGYE